MRDLMTAAAVLPDVVRVAEQLVARYGADKLRQVERLGCNTYRAVLMSGGIVLAIVDKNGALVLRELEEP